MEQAARLGLLQIYQNNSEHPRPKAYEPLLHSVGRIRLKDINIVQSAKQLDESQFPDFQSPLSLA